jgi:acyl dehydratase
MMSTSINSSSTRDSRKTGIDDPGYDGSSGSRGGCNDLKSMARGFEDFPVGTRLVSNASSVITAEAIINFAREFDPQIFHLDPRLAHETIFRGLAASGWHTAGVSMRLFVDTMNVAGGIVGMGVDELKWPNAVRPGDELRLEIEILQARHSKSRPGYGIIRIHNVTKNQRGEVVQSFMANAMLPVRSSRA